MPITQHFLGRRGDKEIDCSVCGVAWYLSEMRIPEPGVYLCPDDKDGMTDKECADSIIANGGDPGPFLRGRDT